MRCSASLTRRRARRGGRRPLGAGVARGDVVGGAGRRGGSRAPSGGQRAAADGAARRTLCGPSPRRCGRADARRGSPFAAPAPDTGLPALPEALVWDGPLGAAALEALETGRAVRAEPRRAGRRRDTRPAARRAGAGPVRRARRQDDRDRGADARRGRAGGRRERSRARASQIEELAERAGARNVRVELGDAAERTPAMATIACWWTRPAPTWGRSRRAPTPAGARTPRPSTASPRCRRRSSRRGVDALRPGGALVYSTCTISRRENEDVTERAGGLARRADASRTRPDRTGPTGSSSPGCDGTARDRGDAAAFRAAPAAASRGCARRTSPAGSAACSACSATSSCRSARTAASIRRSSE